MSDARKAGQKSRVEMIHPLYEEILREAAMRAQIQKRMVEINQMHLPLDPDDCMLLAMVEHRIERAKSWFRAGVCVHIQRPKTEKAYCGQDIGTFTAARTESGMDATCWVCVIQSTIADRCSNEFLDAAHKFFYAGNHGI